MDNREKLLELAQKAYDRGDSSHDYSHILRVMKNAEVMAKELGADLETLIPALILHDVVHVPKNSPLRSQASELSAQKIKEILEDLKYSPEQILKIQNIVREHSFSRGLKASSLESQIMQDADRLDALGAIGIMRWITTGSLMKSSYYDPNDVWAENRELDDKKYTIDHYFTKLSKLPELMNTEYAKKEALNRVQFMKSFLDQLKKEI